MGASQLVILTSPLEEPHCGDQAGCWQSGERTVLGIVDGLGHGEAAQQSANMALDFIGRHHWETLPQLFASCDKALHRSRGVAMGVAVIDEAVKTLTYAGIGNTRALVMGRKVTRLISSYGIVGGGYRVLTPQKAPFVKGNLVVLYTDGIEEIIDMTRYSDFLMANPLQLAQAIIQDWRRKTDDAAVLIYKRGE